MKKPLFFKSFLIAASIFLLTSCKKEEVKPNEFEAINSWILENMKEAYYWTDRIPTSPNKEQTPDLFFKSLLTKPDDRFSWIQENYQDLLNSLQGVSKEAGYEFALYREGSNSNNIIALVLYVKKGSFAESAGLLRGDMISQINNQQITVENYSTLLRGIRQNHTISYKPYDVSTNTYGSSKNLALSVFEYAENPNYLDKIIVQNNRKIGYFVYTLFSTGPTSESNQYNDEMDAVFARFQAAGITDLVLDLRFNSGGYETATINLASLIGKNVDATKVFAKRQYNKTVTNQILNDPAYGADFLVRRFKNKSQNVGSLLKNNRVYILTSSGRTASASELVINALRPYMDVFLIGSTTVGKNVGSISIFDDKDPKNTWGMQPIVIKYFNSLDESNYSNGFTPNIEDADSGSQLPLGDVNERLLSLALQHIQGSGGRTSKTENLNRELIGSSFDFKNRNKELVIDRIELK
jgi:carboxyl-terminal processing protease